MLVQNGSLVKLHLTIRDTSGNLLEATEAGAPVSFPLGAGFLLPAIEEALEGRSIGDEFELQLSPERAFGLVNPEMKRVVSMAELDEGEVPLEPGDTIALDDFDPVTWTVYQVDHDQVYIDGNHPHAGKTINIWLKIAGIDEAQSQTPKGEKNSNGCCGSGGCC